MDGGKSQWKQPLKCDSAALCDIACRITCKYGIQPGDTLRLVDLDGVFVLTPMAPMVSELAREIEQARLEAGLSVEELLNTLREQRNRYHQEK